MLKTNSVFSNAVVYTTEKILSEFLKMIKTSSTVPTFFIKITQYFSAALAILIYRYTIYSLSQFSTYEILSRIYFCKFSILNTSVILLLLFIYFCKFNIKYIGIIIAAIYLFCKFSIKYIGIIIAAI